MADIMQDIKAEDGQISPPASPSPAVPKTPKKRAAKAKADGTPTPKKTKTPGEGVRGKANPVATSAEELSEHDKYLIRLREQEGKGWADIDKAFELLTGQKPAATTLRKRYGRIKAALARVAPEDVEGMKTAYAEVNGEIEEEVKALRRKLWSRVADKMVEAGQGKEKYETATLEKEWKKLVVNGSVVGGAVADAAVDGSGDE